MSGEQGKAAEVRPIYRKGDRVLIKLLTGFCAFVIQECEYREGGTDTAAAFQFALQRIERALQKGKFKDSFPPIVFHLTDGESHTDAEPVAQQITSLSSSDGNVLLVNAYIGTDTRLSYKYPFDFPGYLTEQEVGASPDNLRLFRMSSRIPASMRDNLVNDGIFPAIRENVRLFFDVRTKEMLKHVIQVVGSGGSRLVR